MKMFFSKFTTAFLLLTLSLSLIQADDPMITYIDAGARIIGLEFSDNEKDLMGDGLEEQLKHYKAIREYPTSMCIIGNLFEEEKILAIANQYQGVTDYEDMHPELFQ